MIRIISLLYAITYIHSVNNDNDRYLFKFNANVQTKEGSSSQMNYKPQKKKTNWLNESIFTKQKHVCLYKISQRMISLWMWWIKNQFQIWNVNKLKRSILFYTVKILIMTNRYPPPMVTSLVLMAQINVQFAYANAFQPKQNATLKRHDPTGYQKFAVMKSDRPSRFKYGQYKPKCVYANNSQSFAICLDVI